MARTFSIVFLALALAITATYREAFFATPWLEEGDDAANALQIHRAKRFREIHGNYSQWGFHHPGPAFFYVYALGEAVLHDALRVAPAPRNAHLYAGALLQLAFYAAAVALLARHARQPALVAALAVAAGALHYAHADRAIYSTWPPDVLLMPMLCFVVACAAAASGSRAALPVAALAGGFLVHGHIAQPLFVGPLGLVAVVGAARADATGWRGVVRSRAAYATAALLAVFLLPLAIDATAGRDSNFADIAMHLRYQRDSGQSLLQSLLCYGSYFLGHNDPSRFNDPSADWVAPFVERGWLVAFWFAVGAVATWRFLGGKHRRDTSVAARFGRSLLACWALASALTLVWGMRQDGGLTSYNSHFNHSLVHVLALAALPALAPLLPIVTRHVCVIAGTAAVAAFTLALPLDPKLDGRCDDLAVRLPAILAADPRPREPKLLTFAHEDWYEAVTLARALQHRGIETYVHPDWRVMFGRDRVFRNQRDAFHRDTLSIWQVVQRAGAPTGAHALNRNCAVVFPAAADAGPLPLRLDFAQPGEHARFAQFGIGKAEPQWAWTDASVATLAFAAPPANGPLELALEASGLVTALAPTGQAVRVFVNGRLLATERIPDERRTLRVIIPAELWNARTPRLVVFELPGAHAPATAGLSSDRRLLGLRLYRLTLAPTGGAR